MAISTSTTPPTAAPRSVLPTAVLIDSREPAHIRALRFGGVPTTVVELSAGDVLCMCADGQLVACERKTPRDLLHTLAGGRFYPQLHRLHEMTPWAYLVITGALHPGHDGYVWVDDPTQDGGMRITAWTWVSLQGALLTAQEIGVQVLHVPGDYAFEAAMLGLCARRRGAVRITPPRPTTLLTEQEQVLTALPGVGPERAAVLLEACGTPAHALNFLTDEATRVQVPGVGPGLKRQTRRALGLPPEWGLYVLPHTLAGDLPAITPDPETEIEIETDRDEEDTP